MSRLLLAALLAWTGCAPAPSPAARAVDWLLSRQGSDGLWRSATTPTLSTGQALTPFVLYALSHARDLGARRALLDRALDRLPLGGSEHPTYSLALSILALKRLAPGRDTGSLERELRSMQLAEPLGWTPDDPEYGGWDQGVVPARKPQAQNPNLSITAFASEALGGDPKARVFAARCRTADGGYCFTPSESWRHQNKAGAGRGYATATLDASRILGTVPTQALLPAGEFEASLYYYRAFLETRVVPSPQILSRLLSLQRPDGSFANPVGLMKEDDPLLATSLALLAL
jgi:hypothetical protein